MFYLTTLRPKHLYFVIHYVILVILDRAVFIGVYLGEHNNVRYDRRNEFTSFRGYRVRCNSRCDVCLCVARGFSMSINWETGDILKIKGKTYEIWERGESTTILRSIDARHYFVTLHNTNPYLHPSLYATTKEQTWQTTT